MAKLEFFFDFASPWTYMAYCRVESIVAETGSDLEWRPFDMGDVFEKANPGVATMRANPVPAKITHYYKDMQDWARRLGITIGRPPVYGGAAQQLRCVKALSGALIALERDCISDYSRAMFEAYWHDLRDLSDDDVLTNIVSDLGFDASEFLQRVNSSELENEIVANAEELIARGGFGSPTFFVDGDDMYFGNDRLDFVREALSHRPDIAAGSGQG